ncbi:S8 family serine peptidase [Dyella sp. GSA-30]|uniref:S8 family serine peptidase n=1 Tax=Dyella sp. GSA-30 TaxID=2994496 RepID=UPI002492F93C|nr:S8 family serine peptidase [Dyella sp. GSA-30]BDU22786.1 hypothetical protein DYGSA30_42430 [Dyella sp. GSA-30]
MNTKIQLAAITAAIMGMGAASGTMARESKVQHEATAFAAADDPFWARQWNLHDPKVGIRVEDAWRYTHGEGSVIAVIDSGVTDHEDLRSQLLPGYDFYSDADDSRDGDGLDDDPSDPGDWRDAGECGLQQASVSRWIGTVYAGVAAAAANNGVGITGVAPGAKIVPVRAVGACGGKEVDIADAIIWASGGRVFGVPANANPAKTIIVGPASHGPCPQYLGEAIVDARSRGATVVVPAHNEADDVALINPANCPGVVVVAAADRQGGLARYSSYGDKVSLSAPGGTAGSTQLDNYLLVTYNSGQRGPVRGNYQSLAGTEGAAAQVAGTVAMMYSVRPTLTPDKAAEYLKASARPMASPCRRGCGAGLLDAGAAVRAAFEGR